MHDPSVPDWRRCDKPELPPAAIHLWRLPLDRLELPATLLSPEEQSRLARLGGRGHRWRNAHAGLRLVLAGYLGAPPESLRFQQQPGGKPCLADQPLQFNLSHAGELALVAVARQMAVGVDLERIRPVGHRQRIARRLFGPGVAAELAALPEEAARERFFEEWTLLEARQKCSGNGLFGRRAAVGGSLSFEPAAGFKAALAWEAGPELEIRFFQFEP